MVTITNGNQKWVISEKEYHEDKAKWNARGEVEFGDKDPILEKKEYDLQTEVEIKRTKELDEINDNITKEVFSDIKESKTTITSVKIKDAKKKAKQ